jgi:hypothetical protein
MIAWYHLLEDANSTLEVVAVARDYLASWSPQDIALLPPACRPGKIRDESDIEVLHDALIDEYRTSQASGEELARLQELTSFMVRATLRVAELSDGAAPGGGDAATDPMKSARPRES